MHKLNSSFILGYHGCDSKVADRILAGAELKPSTNNYDWLGPGIYFWENNPLRGLEFARELKSLKRGPDIDKPSVIGAVIDPGLCLDLTTSTGIGQVADAHRDLVRILETANQDLPKNSEDQLRRHLDCAVIEYLHKVREEGKEPRIDTIRGIFVEGEPIYPGSGFREKTHVQLCVCNPECIKGIFRVQARFLK